MEDRRLSERCPVCQGPARLVDGNLRCRTSVCKFNHEHRVCPRCQNQGPDVLAYSNEQYSLKCPECLHQWKES